MDQIIISEVYVTHLEISARSLKLLRFWKLVLDPVSQMQFRRFISIYHCCSCGRKSLPVFVALTLPTIILRY
jgi:hypothetical protein